MKNKILMLSVYVISCHAFGGAQEIPKEFHGTWAENSQTCKAILKQGTDFAGTVITKNTFSQPEEFCKLVSIKSAIPGEAFSGNFKCSSPDGDLKTNISIKLSSGKIILDSGEPKILCKK
jgi:hypothetical protein